MPRKHDNLFLIFYLGTKRLAAVLAERGGNMPRVRKWAELKNAEGFQKGEVTELERAVSSVETLFKKLEWEEQDTGIPTYLLLSNPHLKMARFSSAVHYPGYSRTVTPREVARVIEQTRSVAPLPLEDWVLEGVPESFWVNDLTGIRDPVGLEAQRLAVSLQIFTMNYSAFRNVSRVFETLEFNLKGYFPKTLTLPEGVLNGAEREGEVLIMDFSDGATHLVLSSEGKIAEARSLDLGSRFLTSRVAETWHLGSIDAERLKERFGCLEENVPYGEELIPLVERDGREGHPIKRSEFHQHFIRFADELFTRLEKEVRDLLKERKIAHPSFVLTGGGARLEGILEFLGRRLEAPVRLGTPRQLEGPAELLTDPAWSALSGLLRRLASTDPSVRPALRENALERTFVQAKEWLAAYF